MSKYKDFEFIKTIEDFNEIVDIYKFTHFHYICRDNYSNLEVIKYCIENGTYFNVKNMYGYVPLHYICSNTTIKEVLEYCLNNGADLNIKNKYENTPFHFICKYNKHLIPVCKPYIDEYDFVKTLKKHNLNWKEYV